jgi:hypothetical protein
VDSIKRVEILSAMRERASELPEVDPAELGKLRTLGEIVERMDGAPAGTPAAAPASAATAAPTAARYALRLVDAPPSGFALPGLLAARRVAVTDDGRGVAAALVERLTERGIEAAVVTDPAALAPETDGVIVLGGLADVADLDAALAVQRRAFEMARAVAPRLSTEGGFFVTVQDTGGDFGLSGTERAWLAGLPALVKTAAQEWPEAGLRALDLERGGRDPDALARVVLDELLRGGPALVRGASGGGLEVALAADGRRRTLQSFPAEVTPGAPRVDASSVILASGGARGVTAATLIRLAEASGAGFVLLGRTPLADEPPACAGASTDAEIKRALLEDAAARGERPDPKELGARAKRILAAREVRATLAAIERAGGRARYVAADVQDRDAIAAALAPVRAEWGPITGVVHGAGLLADRLIADKTPAQFDRVFDTKVRGLAALLDVTREDAPSVLIAFSSVAGRCGNRGQSDYAMANETLDKVLMAEARRPEAPFVRSLGWGPWEGGMVTPALRAHFESLGVPLIPLETGAQMLVDELADTSDSVALVLGGEPRAEALASDGRPRHEHRFEVLIDPAGFPAIDAHRVKGAPVLPVALVLELFARAIEACRPDLLFTGCEDVRVLRGVELSRYDAGGEPFVVHVKQLDNGDGATFALELLDEAGRARYRAAGAAARAPRTPPEPLPRPDGLSPFEGPVYDGVALFHGEAFQVIAGAPALGEAGLEAELMGARERGWAADGWRTDPAMVDGALQLALLWTIHDGGAALPTAVGAFRRFVPGLVDGPVTVRLRGIERTSSRSRSDLVLLDAAGTPVAELTGVEMHVLPGSRSAARV